MKDQFLNEAENLFKKFNGSLFGMARDDENIYKQFASYNLSDEQYLIWANELATEHFNEVRKKNIWDNSFSSLFAVMKQYLLIENIRKVISWIEENQHKLDSFTKIMYSESLSSLIDSSIAHEELLTISEKAKKLAVKMLEKVLDNPIEVHDSYLNDNFGIDLNNPEEVRQRAKETLDSLNSSEERHKQIKLEREGIENQSFWEWLFSKKK